MILDEDDINAAPLANPPASNDPPPPYPSRRARRSNRRQLHHTIQTAQHGQLSSTDSHSDDAQTSPQVLLTPGPLSDDHDDSDANETAPFLPPTPRSTHRRLIGRPRSYSHTSTVSVAPSLAQTVLSLFQPMEESDLYNDFEGRLLLSPGGQAEDDHGGVSRRPRSGFFSSAAWGQYFRPMGQKVYYRSLFHLSVINFPYALAAWVYLFVFTVVRALPFSGPTVQPTPCIL